MQETDNIHLDMPHGYQDGGTFGQRAYSLQPQPVSQRDMLASNGNLRESPSRVIPLDQALGEVQVSNVKVPDSFILDKDERELLKKGSEVTKEEMWKLLESKRFDKLKEGTVNLQGDLLYNQRCHKCTLLPPCKHYES